MGSSLRKILKVLKSTISCSDYQCQIRIQGGASTAVCATFRSHWVRRQRTHRIWAGRHPFWQSCPDRIYLAQKACISIGDHTFINYGLSISAHKSVKIGHHCLLGHYLVILDKDESGVEQREVARPSKAVTIEDHVWIGSHVFILPGVSIGQHAAVGAGSVSDQGYPRPLSCGWQSGSRCTPTQVGAPAKSGLKSLPPFAKAAASAPPRA